MSKSLTRIVKFININGSRLLSFYAVLASLIMAIVGSGKRFGSPDDFCTFAASKFQDGCMGVGEPQNNGILKTANEQAMSQGRFYQTIYYVIAQITIQNPQSERIVRILTIIGICWAIYKIVNEFVEKNVSLIYIGLFSTIYSLRGNYNLITGFAGWFSVGILLLLISLYYYVKNLKRKKLSFKEVLIFLLTTCGAMLSYENIVLIYAYLLIINVVTDRLTQRENIFKNLINTFLLLSILIYMTLYLVYRIGRTVSYEGFELDIKNVKEILISVIVLSLGGILKTYETFYLSIDLTIKEILLGILNPIIFIIALKICHGVMKESPDTNNVWYKKSTVILMIIPLIIIPNIPLAVTDRYQVWAVRDPMYLGAFPSYIFLSFCALIFSIHFFQSMKNQKLQITKRILFCGLLIQIFVSSFSNLNYFNNVIEANTQLKKYESEVIGKNNNLEFPKTDLRELDRKVGAYPYRYFEALQYRD